MRMPRRCRNLHIANKAGVDHDPLGTMSKRYEQEQGENAKKIKALRPELKKDESKRMVAELIDLLRCTTLKSRTALPISVS